ncbi:Ldh family oxidoreductase [Oceanibacterium hippocampi]|uniref:(2R)-3-sulfolactate dehydrogenase (NADP(+)) n=1 Tax=Oceanibacterium hippocampi TaxID=745714 RepID=A0A1Y5T205_9PROT|nr:Ldh family oxidoreductase [Oceanibacterium hippocampi]SLN53796.1 (2R)-3-sulfolactate dehydrogenase (NADP(+)) [Oceanibacterium hippocampi]
MTMVRLTLAEIEAAANAALSAHGASAAQAAALARAITAAQATGATTLGLGHLFDDCAALDAGRANGLADPVVDAGAAAVIRVDARGGFPQLGVERGWPGLVAATRNAGVGILALRNGYTSGAIGYFARRLAVEEGVAAIVAANAGPAVMAASGGRTPVFCTNPLAFAMPLPDGPPLVIDQSSSAAAFVRIREAAEAGTPIPEGWALDAEGRPTTDGAAALAGTLLPFGGARGANIALMVEMMAVGLTGGNWSREAPPFNRGDRSPGVGLFILAIDPAASGGADVAGRLSGFLDALRDEPDIHLPGIGKGLRAEAAAADGVAVDAALWARVLALAEVVD